MEFFWRALAWVVSRPVIADRIIAWGVKRLEFSLPPDGPNAGTYMGRWWLFNPVTDENEFTHPRVPIAVQLNHIRRRDGDRARHDHPQDIRVIVLRNWYTEDTGVDGDDVDREAGSTRLIRHTDFHRIIVVPPEGVWTLNIRGRRVQDWGFLVNQRKVLSVDYLHATDGSRDAFDPYVSLCPEADSVIED